MSKKDLLALSLYSSHLIPLVRSMKWSTQVRVLAYHRVVGEFDEEKYPFDTELISATSKQFDWQAAHIAKHYNATTFADLHRTLSRGARPADNSVIITFDDGFDDNYHYALPILRKHGLPATFFVSSGYISRQHTFWFDWVAYLVKSAPSGRVDCPALGTNINITDSRVQREAVILNLLKYLKECSNSNRLRAIEDLQKAWNTFPPTSGHPLSKPASWEQLREMAAAGMEIGSHTVSHPVLTRLQPHEIMAELKDSKTRIEQEIGAQCLALAYPVGREEEFSDEVVELVKAAGYQFACTYISGTNRSDHLDRLRLKRLHIERYTSNARFAAMLACPQVFY